MTIRYQLRCLGEPALIRSDGQAVRIKVRKHLALLVYLVLEGDRRAVGLALRDVPRDLKVHATRTLICLSLPSDCA